MVDSRIKAVLAEFMAMILFVWIGTGAAVSSGRWTEGDNDAGRLITIAIAFGFGISVLAYGIGDISGGHINPAVTLAFLALGEQPIVDGILYMVAQFVGAIVGSFVLWGCVTGMTQGCPDSGAGGVCAESLKTDGGYGPAFGLGVNQVSADCDIGSAFLLEMMGTFLLVITVLNAAVSKKSSAGNAAPIAIGWSVMLAHIILIPYTGCGINPARSLGPMVVDSVGGLGSKAWIRGAWVFYVAPFVGSLLAAGTYKFIFAPDEEEEEKEEPAEVETSA